MEEKQGKESEVRRVAKKQKQIKVSVTFTDGYEERFTQAILKIYAKRLQKENAKEKVAV